MAARKDPSDPRYCVTLCERIECDLCGTRAFSQCLPGAAASFAARGWRLMAGRERTLQVCRNCTRKLGPAWADVTPDPAIDSLEG
jgi:hypothetical protein